jgi:cysteine desulfuration protein SufE
LPESPRTITAVRRYVPVSGGDGRAGAFFRDLGAPRHYIPGMTTIEAIRDDFAFLDEWEDRYRYVIDLGAALPPFPDASRVDAYKVPGCVSQVWLTTRVGDGADPVVEFEGDSDAHIVRGLVAIMLALFSGRRASEIVSTDAEALLRELGLDEHLTPQRANGLRSMVKRIKRDAESALKQTA